MILPTKPGQSAHFSLGDRYVDQLVTARANPLVKYQLAKVVLYYAATQEALDAELVSELHLRPWLKGTSLERQQLVDLVNDVVARVRARPGVYSMCLLSSTNRNFGTMTFETITPLTAGATKPREVAPEAPLRVLLAGIADQRALEKKLLVSRHDVKVVADSLTRQAAARWQL